MPSYGGDSIFGRSPIITMEVQPSEKQYNTFFGLNGVKCLTGGSRGRMFMCSGLIWGADYPGLAAAIANFESYDDGVERTLIDTIGRSWPRVIFDRFQEAGVTGFGHGGVLRPYRAAFVGMV